MEAGGIAEDLGSENKEEKKGEKEVYLKRVKRV